MKIKTITCHDVYNHGASLQAYALMRYLEMEGNEVEIIDYKPDYLSRHYRFDIVSNPKWDKPLLKQLYLLLKFPGRLLSIRRKKKFDEFREKFLHLTSTRYNSFEELKANPPKGDLFIAGSDQIWNTLFPNGKDAAFYLDFLPVGVPKISYAASFATDKIYDNKEEFVSSRINRLDAVSVRESSAITLLESLGINSAIQVVDPVFLLDKNLWNGLVEDLYSEDYILVYDFENSPTIEKIAKDVAKARGCKIYSVSPFKSRYADKSFVNCGPIEFISLIKSSSMVISNSFHGTAFAIIFERDFLVVNRHEGINTRMQSLLTSLSIPERLVGADYSLDSVIKQINYSVVNAMLNPIIESSKLFLSKNIDNAKK